MSSCIFEIFGWAGDEPSRKPRARSRSSTARWFARFTMTCTGTSHEAPSPLTSRRLVIADEDHDEIAIGALAEQAADPGIGGRQRVRVARPEVHPVGLL